MNQFNNIWQAIKRRKALTVLVILLVLLILGGILYLMTALSPARYAAPMSPLLGAPTADFYFGEAPSVAERALSDAPAELEVKEGRAKIKSENADGDAELLRLLTADYEGYLEQSRKTETLRLVRIVSTVRVPVGNFEEFLEDLRRKFDVRTYETGDFRITVQHQFDELDVLSRSLQEYDEIREEIRQLRVGEERIKLLMRITNEETELIRRQQAIERELAAQQKQADMATLEVTLEQSLRPKLWPEDLGSRFFERLNWMVDSIVTAFIGILTNSLVVLIRVIEFIIYAIIIIVPLVIVWRLSRRIHRRFTGRV